MFKLNNMKLPQKFMILGIVVLLAVALPTSQYLSKIIADLDATKHEIAGIAPTIALQSVLQLTQQHRGMSAAGMLEGNESLASGIPAKQTELDSALNTLVITLTESGASSQIISELNSIKQRLNMIKQAVAGRQLKTAESTMQHTRVISDFLVLGEKILDESGLSLDPKITTASLIKATMNDAPKLVENMGQMRAVGTGFLTMGHLSAEGRAELIGIKNLVMTYFKDLTRNLAKATNNDIHMKTALETKGNEVKTQIDKMLMITDQQLINAQEIKLSASRYFEEYTQTINNVYNFNSIAIENLQSVLKTRAEEMQLSLYTMLGVMFSALIAFVSLSLAFVRSITLPIHEAVVFSDAIASGDLARDIDVKFTNEMGQLFQSLNKMSRNLKDEKSRTTDLQAETYSVSKARTMAYFNLDGTIVSANEKFLDELGYTLEEIKGKHCSMFTNPKDKTTPDYQGLWNKLINGEFLVGQYKCVCKSGQEKWFQINYNPVFDANGKVYRVVSYGTDITDIKLQNADVSAQIAAVNEVQAVIEFELDGTIITANDNFLRTTGYTLNEIKGKHHAIFVDAEYKKSSEYKTFWEKLSSGVYDSGNYKRLNKDGKEIWLQASYFPIKDLNDKPWKVVKYATDITEHIRASQLLDQAVEQTLEVISVAKDGDLTKRIPLAGKTGQISTLCSGINTLMENCANSIGEVANVLTALAKGDLTQKITNEYKGVFGQLKDDVNMTVDNLTAIVGDIRAGTESIDTASKEISAGNNDLSQRTEQQASSLEETASSMEELTSTVKQNADNAKQANQLAIGASDVAMQGGTVVGQVVTTMSEINNSSKKIVDIISVIDGIAFQTNILALNAAVEAARAGEQGRGFAVVATEVRTLAQRSAAAAKEIKGLIDDSVNKVRVGTELVDQAGKTMKEIVQSVKRVTDIMSEISAASQEQSSGIEQVNHAVTQMDEVTQQNAALVEEAAAASESMIEQSESLARTVSVFRLKQKEAGINSASSSTKERRGPNRAVNVERLPNTTAQNKPASSKSSRTGTDEEWEEF